MGYRTSYTEVGFELMREILECNHGKWWYKGDKSTCKVCSRVDIPKPKPIDNNALRMGGNKFTPK